MECLFSICHVRSDLKVDYASLQLEGEAFEWWRGQYHSDAHNDWASVCGALEGYFNPYAKEQRVIRAEYERRIEAWVILPTETYFTYALRFVDEIVMAAPDDVDEIEMIILFRQSLPAYIRAAMDFPPALPNVRRAVAEVLDQLRDLGMDDAMEDSEEEEDPKEDPKEDPEEEPEEDTSDIDD